MGRSYAEDTSSAATRTLPSFSSSVARCPPSRQLMRSLKCRPFWMSSLAPTRRSEGKHATCSVDHPLPQQLGAAITAVGHTPQVVGASFWTDAAVLAHAGTPSVLFGPGGAGLHSIEEYVNVGDVLVCRDALVELAYGVCRT